MVYQLRCSWVWQVQERHLRWRMSSRMWANRRSSSAITRRWHISYTRRWSLSSPTMRWNTMWVIMTTISQRLTFLLQVHISRRIWLSMRILTADVWLPLRRCSPDGKMLSLSHRFRAFMAWVRRQVMRRTSSASKWIRICLLKPCAASWWICSTSTTIWLLLKNWNVGSSEWRAKRWMCILRMMRRFWESAISMKLSTISRS